MGTWINRWCGYSDPIVGYTDSLWQKPIREFRLNLAAPLTYVDDAGTKWQPDRHFLTDWGSIPRVCQLMPGYDRERFVGFLLHDSMCIDHGAGHGLWCKPQGAHEYHFEAIPSRQAHACLEPMLLADGARPSLAWAIARAVRWFGPRW